MSFSRLFRRGKEAEDSDIEAKKLEMDYLLAKRELDHDDGWAADERDLNRLTVAASGDSAVTLSGNIVTLSGQTTTSNRVWTSPSITNVSGQTVFLSSGAQIQTAIYERSEDIVESAPNIWCKQCYAGLNKSLQFGYTYSDRGKIWAQCFNCWRKQHERN